MATHDARRSVGSGFPPYRWWKTLFHKSLDHGKWFVFVLLLILVTLGFFRNAVNAWWGFAIVLILVYGFGIHAGIRELVERRTSVRQSLGAIAMMTTLSAATAAAASEILRATGAATYAPADPEGEAVRFDQLLGFYLWMTVDLVPALEIPKWLNLPQPVKAEGHVAGIPVVLFRGFMLLVFFKAIKEWWTGKDRKVAPTTDEQAAGTRTTSAIPPRA